MPKLPVISGIKLVKFLSKRGYELDHQTGSHMILRQKIKPFKRITVPNHKEIAKGTLRAILKQSGISRDEFERLI